MIGIVGLLLPWALIVIDWQFMTEGRQIRGSMSAYYHSPARDLFVGGLVAIGGFLLLYMTGRWRTWEFSLSSVAGFAVWTVAFPAGRAGSERTERSCADFPGRHRAPRSSTSTAKATLRWFTPSARVCSSSCWPVCASCSPCASSDTAGVRGN